MKEDQEMVGQAGEGGGEGERRKGIQDPAKGKGDEDEMRGRGTDEIPASTLCPS